MKQKRVGKFAYWAPRILSILFIAFLALFSLDVFGEGLTFWQVVGAFLMHNIPVFILIAILCISWKYEIVGGITFILAGIAYITSALFRNNFEWYLLSWSLIISGPAFFIGYLFFLNWFRKRK